MVRLRRLLRRHLPAKLPGMFVTSPAHLHTENRIGQRAPKRVHELVNRMRVN
jgi:hypothetical protein